MKAVITVVGKDTVGILANVSAVCAEFNANIEDVSQSVLQDMFCMIMIVDVSKLNASFTDFADKAAKLGSERGLSIHVMHEDIFNSMHRI